MHRDIKPDNVLLSIDSVIKLIDFGTSSTVQKEDEIKRRSTVGTPWYCAPEIINGEEYGLKTDVWSIGCFCIELVSGKPPFDDLNEIACLFKMAEGNPPLPTGISEKCLDFITKCLTNPEQRSWCWELEKHSFLDISLQEDEYFKRVFIHLIKEMRDANKEVSKLTQTTIKL